MAVGVLHAARERGLQVPADLSVVGFDDVEMAAIVTPALTTVSQPLQEMGRLAVTVLYRQINGQPLDANRVELSTKLVVRDSTAPPPATSFLTLPDLAVITAAVLVEERDAGQLLRSGHLSAAMRTSPRRSRPRGPVASAVSGCSPPRCTSPAVTAALVNRLQAASTRPLLVGVDAEAGMGLVMGGATYLPTAMALGAAGDLRWYARPPRSPRPRRAPAASTWSPRRCSM